MRVKAAKLRGKEGDERKGPRKRKRDRKRKRSGERRRRKSAEGQAAQDPAETLSPAGCASPHYLSPFHLPSSPLHCSSLSSLLLASSTFFVALFSFSVSGKASYHINRIGKASGTKRSVSCVGLD